MDWQTRCGAKGGIPRSSRGVFQCLTYYDISWFAFGEGDATLSFEMRYLEIIALSFYATLVSHVARRAVLWLAQRGGRPR